MARVENVIANRERHLLAPYAMHSVDSVGRKHPEPDHSYRGPFQRDRDRVLHSSAFRRLSGKTQVFMGQGDYHRTRLTHTMEVASIARTMGRALRLNEDLIEALALVHDIGHPPFGHAGEDTLSEFLAGEGGRFSHNEYALTLVEELETPYPQFRGLNLTLEMLAGQRSRAHKASREGWPLLEVQIVDLADSMTYDAHDLDDAVKLGWLTLNELSELGLIRQCRRIVEQEFGALPEDHLRQTMVHELINCQVRDVLQVSLDRLRPYADADRTQLSVLGFRLAPSAEMAEQKEELERFLYQRLYRHQRLLDARERVQFQLMKMAHHLCQFPEQLPQVFQKRIPQVGLRRGVVEYLAGMTDGHCWREFDRLQFSSLPAEPC